jgi:hypothetical protein
VQIRYSCRRLRPILGAGGPHCVSASDPEAIAEDIIRDVGSNLLVGLPLGRGKANHIVNALCARWSA